MSIRFLGMNFLRKNVGQPLSIFQNKLTRGRKNVRNVHKDKKDRAKDLSEKYKKRFFEKIKLRRAKKLQEKLQSVHNFGAVAQGFMI